jgi:hypothetical protein
MRKSMFVFGLLLVFVFAFGFSASMVATVAHAAPCPCVFWCGCAEANVYGDYTAGLGHCWNSLVNQNCICPCL